MRRSVAARGKQSDQAEPQWDWFILKKSPLHVHFYQLDGSEIPTARLRTQLTDWTPVIISSRPGKLKSFFAAALRPGTLVCYIPFQPPPDPAPDR